MNRVDFYLGNLPYTNLVNLHTKTIHDLKIPNFELGLKELIKKNNFSNRRFHIDFNDIQNLNNPACLVKNRYNSEHSVIIRCIDFDRHWNLYYNKPPDIPFEEKLNTVFWRGATTGNSDRPGNRFTLVKKWAFHPGMDIGFSNIVQKKYNYIFYVKNVNPIEYFLKHKYILSVEGNDKDTGIQWKLNSNSLVMMAKPRCTSWLMETTLIPNYHYVLLKDDFSDLEEKVSWCNKHPNECKQIIQNANDYMSQFSNEKVEVMIENAVIQEYFKRVV